MSYLDFDIFHQELLNSLSEEVRRSIDFNLHRIVVDTPSTIVTTPLGVSRFYEDYIQYNMNYNNSFDFFDVCDFMYKGYKKQPEPIIPDDEYLI